MDSYDKFYKMTTKKYTKSSKGCISVLFGFLLLIISGFIGFLLLYKG